MNFGAERYYRASGAVPIGGLLVAGGCSVIGATLSGFGYAFLNAYNPFVYVTFLGTCVFAFLVGMSVIVGLRLGKVRNSTIGLLVGLTAGAYGLWFAWVTYIWIQSDYAPVLNMVNLVDPRNFFGVLHEIAQVGLWSMKGGTPTGGGLYTIWSLEAAIVILGAGLIAWQHDSPFCERCLCWTDDHTCDVKLPVSEDLAGLKIDLENEMYDRLVEMARQPIRPEDHITIKIASCPSCEESTWMTLERVVTTVNGKGETNTSTEKYVHQLSIPRERATALKEMAANELPPDALAQFQKGESEADVEDEKMESV